MFDYFHYDDCEQFAFYRIPKMFVKEPKFKSLSANAKLLYGLFLDRMSLSRKNNWLDENGHVYIYYTITDIMDDLDCGKETAVKIVDELKKIGLIEKKRQGQGKPSIIYVKNFSSFSNPDKEDGVISQEPSDSKKTAESLENTLKSEKPTSRSSLQIFSEVGKTDFMISEKPTSRSSKADIQKVGKTDSNYNNINNTDISDNNINYTEYLSSIHPSQTSNAFFIQKNPDEKMDRYSEIVDMVKQNICYDSLVNIYKFPTSKRIIDGIVNIIADILAFEKDYVFIEKTKYPYSLVKDKFSQLEYEHIDYILKSLENSKTKIVNTKAYLITALYNSIDTLDLYYQNDISSADTDE